MSREMKDRAVDQHKTIDDVVDAVQDLTRVIIAVHGEFESQSEAIRKLHDLSIPANRIAAILAMRTSDVSSVIIKDKKKAKVKEVLASVDGTQSSLLEGRDNA